MLIAIDHGNKQIKTVHAKPFTSGLIQSDAPGFGTDYLAYQGKFYALTDQRIPYRRDKTEDERFFILTLFAIAYEIEATEQYLWALRVRSSAADRADGTLRSPFSEPWSCRCRGRL